MSRGREQPLGDRVADAVTAYIGSWNFVIWFNLSVAVWIAGNLGLPHPFDPWPFILLNLVFSWIAGVQGPIIMISQRRQERIMIEMARAHLAISKACQVALAGQSRMLEAHQEELRCLRADILALRVGAP